MIEAKDETQAADAGLEQAKEYARMLDVPFAYSSNGHGFVEFDFFLNRSRELYVFPGRTSSGTGGTVPRVARLHPS